MAATYPVLAATVTLTSSNNQLVVEENSGASSFTITLVAGDYYLSGDGGSDDLLEQLKTQLDAGTLNANTYTVALVPSIDASGVTATITVTSSATNHSLRWADGSTTLDGAVFGFSGNTSPATTSTSDVSPTHTWTCNQPGAVTDPESEMAEDIFHHETPEGQTHTAVLQDDQLYRVLGLRNVAAARTWRTFTTSDVGRAFQTLRRGYRNGKPVRLWMPAVSSGTDLAALASGNLEGTYNPDEATLRRFSPERVQPGVDLFGWEVRLKEYVS